MKNIMILATGGTIASAGKAGATTDYNVGLLVESLTSSVQGLDRLANISAEQVINIGSSDMTLGNWLTLAKRINELAARPDIDGFVVTHGTDTMEETAYFLHLTVKTDKPVVLTGAMRPATATSADGPLNLYQAVLVASQDEAKGKGVMVVFADTIFGGREVQKMISSSVDAFGGRQYGCMGVIRGDNVFFLQASLKKHTTATEFDVSNLEELPHVPVSYFSVDDEPGVIDWYAEHAAALVLAGSGGAAVSKRWRDYLKQYADKGFIVVRSTRVADGVTVYEEKRDGQAGSIPAMTLPPQKAKVLLTLALTKTCDKAEIARMFKEY